LKIKQILTDKEIRSFFKIEHISFCVSFIGIAENGCSTELVRSEFYIKKSGNDKYTVVRNPYFDQYIDEIKTIYVTEIDFYIEITGFLNPEYVTTTLNKYTDIYKEKGINAVCAAFESQIRESFSRIIGNNAVSVKINRRRGMFRNIYSKIEFEASLNYSKKIKRYF